MTKTEQEKIYGIAFEELNKILDEEHTSVEPEREYYSNFLYSIGDLFDEEGFENEIGKRFEANTIVPFYPANFEVIFDDFDDEEAA